jgi:hypothetical protein
MVLEGLCATNQINFELSTTETNTLEDLLDLDEETTVKDWTSELNMTEVTWTFGHSFLTSLTFEVSVDS